MELKPIELTKGELVKRKEKAKKVFINNGYCRTNRAYELQNYEDIGDYIYLKKGTNVFTNFDY